MERGQHRHVAYVCIGCGLVLSCCPCFGPGAMVWPSGRCEACRQEVPDPLKRVDGVAERIGRGPLPPGQSIQQTVWHAIGPDGAHLVDLEVRTNLSRSRVFSALESMLDRGIVTRVRHGVYARAQDTYVPPRMHRRH